MLKRPIFYIADENLNIALNRNKIVKDFLKNIMNEAVVTKIEVNNE